MELLYGNCHVQIPNRIFKEVSNRSKNVQQMSFAVSYIVTVTLLYKYSHFVDVGNNTYIQNSDIKEILGYNKRTKSIDVFIKKGGVLEELGLITTTKKYPVSFYLTDETINDISVIEFEYIDDVDKDSTIYNRIKSVVKNRNYEIKEPVFLFNNDDDIGTLYDYSNTVKATLNEFLYFMNSDDLDNIDFILYLYFKWQCYGLEGNVKRLSFSCIEQDIKIGNDAFYSHIKKLQSHNLLFVCHKGWQDSDADELESNDYMFKVL